MIVFRYASFALLAIALNLLIQSLVFNFYSGAGSLYVALLCGTFAGLVLKYLLDKYFIFSSVIANKKMGSEFFLYSLVGVFTTAFFWITEISFYYIFKTEAAKYIGACIGLVLGYYAKYQLDKRYVFTNTANV